jgi:hypothetical protein
MQDLFAKWKSPLHRSIARWGRSKVQRSVEWQFSPHYWRWRERFSILKFRVRRFLFSLRYRWRNVAEAISIIRGLLFQIATKLFLAITVIVLLEVGEGLFLSNRQLLPLAIQHFITSTTNVINRDPAGYGNLLSTLAQIAGIFLGLYFTAVSVVASTVYARVQGDVRSLLLRDKLGNHYINIVAFLAAYATILLGLIALGHQPAVLSLVAAAVVGVAAVFSFVVLGYRSFHFFDPTNLATYLLSDLTLWIRNATPGGLHWSDPAFQAHYQRQAADALSTYGNIVALANSEQQLQSGSLLELSKRTFSLLQFYAREKLSIPTQSRWFRRTYRHKDWLTAHYSETSIALNTGTVLAPDQIPNITWFEREIGDSLRSSLGGLLSRMDLPNAYEFFNAAQLTIGYIAKKYGVQEALQIFKTLTTLIYEHSHNTEYPSTNGQENVDSLKFALALIDLHGLSFISILLGASEVIRSIDAKLLKRTIKAIRWQSSDGIYRTQFPRKVVEQLEYLRTGLEFERAVEGRYISPDWYLEQNVAISFLRFIEDVVSTLITQLEKVTIVEVNKLISEKRPLFAAQLIQRSLEACNKFSHHYVEFEQFSERLAELRKMQDMPWPIVNWKLNHEKISSVRKELMIALAQLLTVLEPRPVSDLPDYFGYAYSVVAEECFAAMANGDDVLFQKLFPSYFSASIDAHQRCIANPVSTDSSMQFGYSAQPIIDTFELSGYSILFQELDGKGYWDTARKVWDAYIGSFDDRKAIVQALNAFGNYELPLVVFPRSMLRTSWETELGRRLREEGLAMNEFDHPFHENDDDWVEHSSPIIRVLARSVILLDEARKFFTIVYFGDDITSGNIDASPQIRELYESLNRERMRTTTGGK